MFPAALLLFGLAFLSELMSTNMMLLRTLLSNDRRINQSVSEQVMVEPEDITYHVLLQNATSDLYFCAGTLLNRLHVLTAAECVVNRQCEEIRVHAGQKNLNLTKHWYVSEVREIIIHHNYDPVNKWHNDIALVRLTSYFTNTFRNGFSVPVPYSYDFEQMIKEARPLPARVFGYGIISENAKPTSYQMLKANIHIYTLEFCKKMFNIISYTLSTSVICAYDPEYQENFNLSRTSDVGSSLIYDSDKVVGIALSANWDIQQKDINVHYPLLFTNTSLYSEWIRSHMTDI